MAHEPATCRAVADRLNRALGRAVTTAPHDQLTAVVAQAADSDKIVVVAPATPEPAPTIPPVGPLEPCLRQGTERISIYTGRYPDVTLAWVVVSCAQHAVGHRNRAWGAGTWTTAYITPHITDAVHPDRRKCGAITNYMTTPITFVD